MQRFLKLSWEDKTFVTTVHVLLGIIGLICLFPLLHILAVALSSSAAVEAGRVTIWPIGWNWDALWLLLYDGTIIRAFWNSVQITVVGTILSMVATIATAYPLSRPYFYGRKFFSLAIIFTMMFGGGLIPGYMVIRWLGLLDSYWSLWLPGLISAYNMWVLRTFFSEFSPELEDAARIDGCGEIRLLISIILPLSLPVIATLSLFYAIGYWNNFMSVLLYIQDSDKFNLPVLVQQKLFADALPPFLNRETLHIKITPAGIRAAADLLMIIPMLLVYPFIQKHFVKGVLLGSVKG